MESYSSPSSPKALPFGTQIACLLLLALSATAALADTLQSYLTPATETVEQGATLTIRLELANLGDSSEQIAIDQSLDLTLTNQDGSQHLTATLQDSLAASAQELASFASTVFHYELQLPSDATGLCSISNASSRFLLNIQPNAVPQPEPTPVAKKKEKKKKTVVDPFRELEQNPHLWVGAESDVVSIYEPSYFDIGASEFLNSKFQLSLKYRAFSSQGALAKRNKWVSNIFFRYTQTSLWDLESDSAPFIDTSYKPGFFYLQSMGDENSPLRSIEWGANHQSNGRDGPESRSTNYIYFKPMFKWDFEPYYVSAGARIWAYVENDDKTNGDIANYWGNFDAFFAFGKQSSYQFVAKARTGDQWNKGRVQLEFFYPLHKAGFENLPIHLHASYFYGYGESLLNYNVKDSRQLRIGFALSQY
ncbi:phospholipase A [Pelagicoccus mobilis]|uniref:Phosphatidylcholine 1-acylhydrolase n=1 Tax=Pelagicoccus mobilis TaxID=415221 RepID=A0A934S548_9BACT|nr:phospholipase A [Pelagicoccus mobilis]MBK1879138.1 phospholipase A [Pelagicoccus mobilis]